METRSPKILILPSWYLPMGGSFCRDQAIALQNKGIDVTILANVELPWTQMGIKSLTLPWGFFSQTEEGIPTHRHYLRRIPRSETANFHRWVSSTLKQVDHYIATHGKPDLIHAHSAMWAGYAAALIREKQNIPYIITEHRGRFSERAQSRHTIHKKWQIPCLQKAFSDAELLIPVSSLLVSRLTELSGHKSPVIPVSNIVDTDFFQPLLSRPATDHFTFFTANSFDDAKAYDILLEAFDQVCTQHSNVNLVIAGGGFQNSAFRAMLKNCKAANKITFTGFLDKTAIRQNLWSAHAFVLASRVESQSIAVLEAMSTGLPVVCTDVVPDEVVTPQTGYKVPVNNAVQLAEAMHRMVQNSQSFSPQTIVAQARNIASPDVVAQKLIDIYHQILQ